MYRFFDEEDNLLYIGRSIKFAERMAGHLHHPHYGSRTEQVRYIEIEWFDDEESAAFAEASAIKHEQPLWNVLNSRPNKRTCRVTKTVEL